LFALLWGCAGVVSPGSSSSETFRLSGTISPQSAGNGTTVALSGPISASTTNNSSGNYSFSGLANGTYAVTPSRSGYLFAPSVQSVSIDGSDVSGIDFTASLQSTYSVQLTWQASTSNVIGYNVYRSTINGGPYVKINSTLVNPLTYTDSSVASFTTYYYVTTAVDPAGVESEYSNQATAEIF
jgi:fibronectin type 3 domain-containing protein